MIPNLPRPLLWTEKTAINAFLDEEPLSERLYSTVNKLIKKNLLSRLDYLEIFNELYYQLTRYYYEKPDLNDFHRYYNDIKKDLGQVVYADLVMTMMFHYCRFHERNSVNEKDTFMIFIGIELKKNEYWNYFQSMTPPAINWVKNVCYPEKPTPVTPEKLKNMRLDWSKITRDYDLGTIKELLNLWGKEEDKKNVASILMNIMPTSGSSLLHLNKGESVIEYLMQVKEGEDTKIAPNKKLNSQESEGEKLDFSTMSIEELKRENKKLKDDISKISAERDEYMKQAVEMAKQLETANKDIQNAYQETKKSNELTKQQIEEIDLRIKNMVEKLGNTTIPLKTLVDGIKDFIQMNGPEKGSELLMSLSLILQGESVWVKNVGNLKDYLINTIKDNKQLTVKFENAQVTMQQPTINGPLNEIHDNDNVNLGGK